MDLLEIAADPINFLTLGVGVLTSLFTALLVTQVLIGWWFKATRPKQLPI